MTKRGAFELLRRAAALLRSAWLIAGVCLVALIAADRLATLWVNARDQRDLLWRLDSDAYRGEPWAHDLWQEYSQLSSKWEPFAYYRLAPFKGRFYNIDEDGLRRTWNPAPPSERSVVIAVYGGSTAWGFGERDEGTIPSLLSRLLSEAGYSVSVENHAQIGYVSTQEVIALWRSLQGPRVPRIVIFYDGFNDVLSLLRNQRAGLSLDERGRAAGFDLPNDPSQLVDGLLAHSGLERLVRYAPPPQSGGALEPERVDSLTAAMAQVYATNVRIVEEAGRAAGFKPIFFWQPTLHSPKKRQSPFEARMAALEKGFSKALHDSAHRAVTREPRLAADPAFHDLEDAFADVELPLFIDRAHLNQAGNEIIARRMLKDVIAVLKSLTPEPAPAK